MREYLIIESNEEYKNLNNNILCLEKKIKSRLDEEGVKIFLEYEKLIMDQLEVVNKLFQKNCT